MLETKSFDELKAMHRALWCAQYELGKGPATMFVCNSIETVKRNLRVGPLVEGRGELERGCDLAREYIDWLLEGHSSVVSWLKAKHPELLDNIKLCEASVGYPYMVSSAFIEYRKKWLEQMIIDVHRAHGNAVHRWYDSH